MLKLYAFNLTFTSDITSFNNFEIGQPSLLQIIFIINCPVHITKLMHFRTPVFKQVEYIHALCEYMY